ncbi:MAG: hypothetical protein MMC23_004436 [Stictis urceolatum]|nr:hypothetical protein [Stictis urceolata]
MGLVRARQMYISLPIPYMKLVEMTSGMVELKNTPQRVPKRTAPHTPSKPGSPKKLLQSGHPTLPGRPGLERDGHRPEVKLGANRLVFDLPLEKKCYCYRIHLTNQGRTSLSIENADLQAEVIRDTFQDFAKLMYDKIAKQGEQAILVTDYRAFVISLHKLPTGEIPLNHPRDPCGGFSYRLEACEMEKAHQLRSDILSGKNATLITSQQFVNTLLTLAVDDYHRSATLDAIVRAVTQESKSRFTEPYQGQMISDSSLIPLKAIHGMPISVRPFGSLFVDLGSKVEFSRAMTLRKLLDHITPVIGFGDELHNFLKNVKIQEMFGNENKRRIRGLMLRNSSMDVAGSSEDFLDASSYSFKTNDGQHLTVRDYFHKTHGESARKRVLDNTLVVDVGRYSQARGKDIEIMLPSNLLRIIPSDLFQSKLTKLYQSQLIEVAKDSLQRRKVKCMPRLIGSKDGNPEQFGLHTIHPLNDNPHRIQISGGCMNPQKLVYAGGSELTASNGIWNLNGTDFAQSAKIESFIVVQVELATNDPAPKLDLAILDKLSRSLQIAKLASATLSESQQQIYLDEDEPQGWCEMIQSVLKGSKATDHAFYLLVLPEVSSILYNRFKRVLDLDVGASHICALSENLHKDFGLRQMSTLAHKINLKAGGTNLLPAEEREGTMIVGLQLLHVSTERVRDVPSNAVITTSLGPNSTRCVASVATRPAKSDDSDLSKQDNMIASVAIDRAFLTQTLTDRIKTWTTQHGSPPSHVLIYRSGISTSQFAAPLAEASWISSRTSHLTSTLTSPSLAPSITLLLCTKNSSTRLTSPHPIPPTVIDPQLTTPRTFSFYLHSQLSQNKKSVKPTHFLVLHDTKGYGARRIQDLTHALCHERARDARAVGVLAPLYWAGLAARRAGAYLRDLVGSGAEREMVGEVVCEGTRDGDANGKDEGRGATRRERREERERRKVRYEDLPEAWRWNGKVHERVREGTWFV